MSLARIKIGDETCDTYDRRFVEGSEVTAIV